MVAVVQLAEHRIVVPGVVGSSPISHPILLNSTIVARWSSLVARRAHNPKAGGSNPPLATKSNNLYISFLKLL